MQCPDCRVEIKTARDCRIINQKMVCKKCYEIALEEKLDRALEKQKNR
jgi:hypothetical protein